jgi:hypothetical protein
MFICPWCGTAYLEFQSNCTNCGGPLQGVSGTPPASGEAAPGVVVALQEDVSVSVNDRHPWEIHYKFQVGGQDIEGHVTTLNQPGPRLQVGKAVCVLFLPADAKWNSIYPHP